MTGQTLSRKPLVAALCVLSYVAVVHTADTLAANNVKAGIDWGMFRWRLDNGFDLFKFVVWFAVPFAFCIPRMRWSWFSFKGWRKLDIYLLSLLALSGAIAVLAIRYIPSLNEVYGYSKTISDIPSELIYTFSWLLGWEFIHRYALLRRMDAWLPKLGWLVVPIVEGVYHLQKPPIEAVGMVAFSLVVTFWARKRRNALLPFFAHLIIELELLCFMVLI